MNHHKKRAVAGSSRALTDHTGAIETGVLLGLSGHVNKSFSQLVRELEVSQSALAAACVALASDGWLHRIANGNFQLSARGLDMLAA
jgi:DNA-binding HxlR family transcriptional regulator